MAKSKAVVEMLSYGIYSTWDSYSKALPKVKKFTTEITAEIDIEFGFIIYIKKAKGCKLYYCIYHPDIPDKKGKPLAPFDGEEYVRSNDWDFYLGDTIWEPIDNKVGDWRMIIEIDGKLVAEKTFSVNDEASFWR